MACGGCGARRNRAKRALTTVAKRPSMRNARKLAAELGKGAAEMAGLKEHTALQEDEKDKQDGE